MEKEIDLKDIFEIFIRGKKIVFLSTALSIIFSSIFLIFRKPIWQGQFRLVIKDQKENPITSFTDKQDKRLLKLLSPGYSKDLKTEVEILKSPSVLKPAFKFINQKRKEKNDFVKELEFQKWLKKHVKISLYKGTKVLDFIYQDKDKDIILNVLNLISNEYKKYSIKDRNQEIERGIDYLTSQINLYKTKSTESLKEAQKYAMEQDLSALKDSSNNEDEIINFLPLEITRVKAAMEIRKIEEQLKFINEFNNKEKLTFEYYAGILKENPDLSIYLQNSSILNRKQILDVKLLEASEVYKPNDEEIAKLQKERDLLLKEIKLQTINSLKVRGDLLRNIEKSSQRPKGVILKYKELLRENLLNNQSLTNLESQLKILSLERARSKDPWELITQPTLSEDPITSGKLSILLMGSFIGLFTGFGLKTIEEYNSNIIYRDNRLETLLNSEKKLTLYYKNNNEWYGKLKFLIENIANKSSQPGSLALIYSHELKNTFNDIEKKLMKELKDIDLLITEDYLEAKEFKNKIVLISKGSTKYKFVEDIRIYSNIEGKNLDGWIFIE
tara:strand:+ start:95 stop:1765 length:1671 start_codon:yes stop_codon:yes gene_type:complete